MELALVRESQCERLGLLVVPHSSKLRRGGLREVDPFQIAGLSGGADSRERGKWALVSFSW